MKYTIDHPTIDITSNDTKMISLYFSEIENTLEETEETTKKYDLEAMS